MSIRSRLAATYGAGVALTLVIVGVFVWWQFGLALRSSLDTTLQTRAAGVLSSLENAGQAGLQESDQAAPGVFAALFSVNRALVEATLAAPHGIRPLTGVVTIEGRDYLLRTQPAPDGTLVVTGADLQPIEDTQAALARLLAGVGVAAGALSLVGGWLLAGRALRPVDRLIDDARSMGPGNLDRRLAPPVRLDELGRLTVTLNGLLDRIAESVERQRLFVAMASHELRTPLAALRAELDIAQRPGATMRDYREAMHLAQGDANRLTSLATSLLELATTQGDARSIKRTDVHLGELVGGVIRDLDGLARQRQVPISIDVPDVIVWVDRTRLEHALGNLLSNAIVHGAAGGVIEVTCRIDEVATRRMLTVEVLDRGPGLGNDRPAELFEPFRRGRAVRGAGSGLGLATVAGAIRAHDGTFGAANRDGGGARFWFTIGCDSPQMKYGQASKLEPDDGS